MQDTELGIPTGKDNDLIEQLFSHLHLVRKSAQVVTLHNFIPEGEGGAACFAFRPEDRIS
jgi:hypothetical protein